MRWTANFQRFNASQLHALDTCRNLAVRANAGSGKTSVVVERVVQLLAKSWDDSAPLGLASIVAITFTRKAAVELQERLADSFGQLAATTDNPLEKGYWAELTRELPRAMVGTIDSFCARILREFGLLDRGWDRIEPDFEPLEGHEETVLKREAIDRVLNRLSSSSRGGPDEEQAAQVEACSWWAVQEGYDTLVRHLETLLNHVLDPETIMAAHRDLPPVSVRVTEDWAALPVVQRLQRERDSLLLQLRALESAIAACKHPGVNLRKCGEEIQKAAVQLQDSRPQSDEQALRSLARAFLTDSGTERKQGLTPVAKDVVPLQQAWASLLREFDFDNDAEVHAREAADRLVRLLGPVHEEYLRLCLSGRRFDFLTLARRTKNLLKNHPEVRAELKKRWRYVMVDEFQDTNELQWEIISWIVGSGPDKPLDEDRLFVVGDPQQSIYRFRHADVGVFTRVQERIRASNQQYGHAERPTLYDRSKTPTSSEEQRLGLMPLAENYRSLSPTPLGLLDRVFRHVFDPAAHGLDLEQHAFEVRYQPLAAGLKVGDPNKIGEVRYVVPLEQPVSQTGKPDLPQQPDEEEGTLAGEDLGRLQVQAVVEQLVSLYGRPKYTAGADGDQTLTWKDMAVLLPSRSTVLTELEKEFRRRDVPFIVTKGIGFWQRQEIRDVINLTACLADSGEELAFFAVARSPLAQLSDTEILFLSQLGSGSLVRGLQHVLLLNPDFAAATAAKSEDQDYLRQRLQDLPPPIRAGLSAIWQALSEQGRQRLRKTAGRLGSRPLGSWRRRVDRMAHADLLQRCLEESGAYAIYAADAEGDLRLANLSRLFDLIRTEEGRSAPGLARLARWLRDQMNDSLKEEQATLAPEGDAVQIMTVHAAKGLEFPVVAVMKMERQVKRHSAARLLVKNAHERLLQGDAGLVAEPRAGTVAVKIRHPRRPREPYKPYLFRALHRLDLAQQLAESRRLFYVAATRAKERLILAGRQPSRGGSAPESWQKWFEDALGISEEHLAQNVWQDATQGYRVQIITTLSAGGQIGRTKRSLPDTRLALGYIHERPNTPLIATTSLEQMRERWRANAWEWWLKYRMQLDPHVKSPSIDFRSEESQTNGGQLGTVIGTLVHRLFEMPGPLQTESRAGFRQLLEAMAASLLLSASSPGNAEEDSTIEADPHMVGCVADAVEQIWQRLYASGSLYASASGGRQPPVTSSHQGADAARSQEVWQIRQLLEAAGETEVPFILKLGRWQVSGRYDKLLATDGGFEIVDWKTDKDEDAGAIARRHEPQMRLYALALHRAGLAGYVNGSVRVHLVLLHLLQVWPLRFSPSELEEFAGELAKELHEMDVYDPV